MKEAMKKWWWTGKIKNKMNKMKELQSTSVILQKHVENSKNSNEELQKNVKKMSNTEDIYAYQE